MPNHRFETLLICYMYVGCQSIVLLLFFIKNRIFVFENGASIVIGINLQAKYLFLDDGKVKEFVEILREKKIWVMLH